MPRRKRPKSPSPARPSTTTDASSSKGSVPPSSSTGTDDAIGRFASALRDSEERERARRAHEQVEREHAETLAEARVELERAIAAVRTARSVGRGGPEADAAWRSAKARVIELETGAPPEWAGPADATDPGVPGDTVTDPDDDPADSTGTGDSGDPAGEPTDPV